MAKLAKTNPQWLNIIIRHVNELGLVIAGIMSSAIIGAIYLTPVAYLARSVSHRRFERLALSASGVLALVLALCGTLAFGTTELLGVLSSIFVLEALLLTPTLIASKLG